MIEMDNPQNEYEDDFLSKVDNTWMMNEAEEWNMLQNSAQNLSEMIEKLESKVENNFQSLTEKITGIGICSIFFLTTRHKKLYILIKSRAFVCACAVVLWVTFLVLFTGQNQKTE